MSDKTSIFQANYDIHANIVEFLDKRSLLDMNRAGISDAYGQEFLKQTREKLNSLRDAQNLNKIKKSRTRSYKKTYHRTLMMNLPSVGFIPVVCSKIQDNPAYKRLVEKDRRISEKITQGERVEQEFRLRPEPSAYAASSGP